MQHKRHHREGPRIQPHARPLGRDPHALLRVGPELGGQQLRQQAAAVPPRHLVVRIGKRLHPPLQRGDVVPDRAIGGRVLGDQRADHREDVLDPVVQLLVQHPLANARPAALLGHHLVVTEHDLDGRRPCRLGDLEVGLGPGLGLPLDGLLPDREALARRQAVAEGAGRIGLLRVAAPVQGVDELPAEEEQVVPRELRQRHREQPRGVRVVGLGRRMRPRQRFRRPHAPLRRRADEGGELRNGLWRRRVAMGTPRPVHPQPDTVAGQQRREVGQVVPQQRLDVPRMGGEAQEAVERPPRRRRRVEAAPLLQRMQAHREELPEELGRGPLRHRQDARRVVMAGDQPPQPPIGDHRDRHRRGDAHVLQVLAVDGRDAAQVGERQVERTALRRRAPARSAPARCARRR